MAYISVVGIENTRLHVIVNLQNVHSEMKRVYGQYSIETIHERRKRNREFSGLFVRLSIKGRK